MKKTHRCILFPIVAFLCFEILTSSASAATDHLDVVALQDLYKNLGYPTKLTGWRSDDKGDPCQEAWKGIGCDGTSVTNINLDGLDLSGHLGEKLNLLNLWQLNLRSNNISGELPSEFPRNVSYIDLSCNNFSMSVPYSLAPLKHLRQVNLSHNHLSGPIGNLFTDLHNLKEMDLSYNSLSGDLPSSFQNLTNLTGLYLQHNNFTGSVIFLANLHLTFLNIQDNNFSGVIPRRFRYVPNLWMAGNSFQIGADYPPWDFHHDIVPTDQNINSPPTTESNAIENYPSRSASQKKPKRVSAVGIACAVGGVALVATCAAIIVAMHARKARVFGLHDLDGDGNPLPISTNFGDYPCSTPEESSQSFPSRSSPVPMMRLLPSVRHGTTENLNKRKSFPKKSPVTAKSYTVAELQTATNSFSEENLLGEGSLGSVFKAEFPDGQVLAVKNICTVALSMHEEEQFLDVVSNVARLRHPNIVTLVGYCMEHEQHLLVYEYVRNSSLENALHQNGDEHLNWGLRLRIALSVARALDYLHSTCLPPVAHGNLKAANILLDYELMPRLSDCGLAILRPLASNSIKLKASEMAISCTGYSAPENSHLGTDKLKSDIYSFGVLLLELLTGRKPFDVSRPIQERSLLKWGSSRLHDYNSLVGMVDPTIRRMISPRLLSRFSYIIALCIQTDPMFRPPMIEVVESLELLNERCSADGYEGETFEMSFHTTNTEVLSPVTSCASV